MEFVINQEEHSEVLLVSATFIRNKLLLRGWIFVRERAKIPVCHRRSRKRAVSTAVAIIVRTTTNRSAERGGVNVEV